MAKIIPDRYDLFIPVRDVITCLYQNAKSHSHSDSLISLFHRPSHPGEGRKIDPTFYPVIYGAYENDDWTDPAVWKKANPSLDITVYIDKVQTAYESA